MSRNFGLTPRQHEQPDELPGLTALVCSALFCGIVYIAITVLNHV